MQNRQLERELKQVVQGLRGEEILRVIDALEQEEALFLNKNFTKSGINCTCCTLTQDAFVATGFGRTQQEALINATKNYLETLIATNTLAPLRAALRHRTPISMNNPSPPGSNSPALTSNPPLPTNHINNQTLQLEDMQQMSEILSEEKGSCGCVYYEVHKHHMAEIKNLETRMKLISKENEMLKQLLLKDSRYREKENLSCKTNQ